MSTADFFRKISDAHPVLSDTSGQTPLIEHFGDLSAELAALHQTAVLCPLNSFSRIQVTGVDRAKYLHNFCTNQVRELQNGHACEAFFTDVKAKILAHGYILALEDVHEIWMLAGDEAALLQHLNRYVITEDVTFTSLSADATTLALLGPSADGLISAASVVPGGPLTAGDCRASADLTAVACRWGGFPVVLFSTSLPSELWDNLVSAGAVPAGQLVFEHQRIVEGFPRFGTDISSLNLAPEGGRNRQAICYTKGCYLGQEPIARIDAMGHVNRELRRCQVELAEGVELSDQLPVVTSVSKLPVRPSPGLVMLPIKFAGTSEKIFGRCADDRTVALVAIQTADD